MDHPSCVCCYNLFDALLYVGTLKTVINILTLPVYIYGVSCYFRQSTKVILWCGASKAHSGYAK